MDHKRYVARRRAKFQGASGPVNIPWGAVLEVEDGFLWWNGSRLCATTSQNAYDYFSQDDDGNGRERGELVRAILARLEKRDKDHQARWDKIWPDARCQKYRRPEHEDFWIWNYDFFNAPVEDLQHIAGLIGASVKVKN